MALYTADDIAAGIIASIETLTPSADATPSEQALATQRATAAAGAAVYKIIARQPTGERDEVAQELTNAVNDALQAATADTQAGG